MWIMKQRSKTGQAQTWTKNKEISFCDTLELLHSSRIKTLSKLKWII